MVGELTYMLVGKKEQLSILVANYCPYIHSKYLYMFASFFYIRKEKLDLLYTEIYLQKEIAQRGIRA